MDITGRIFDRLTSRYGRETVFRDIDSIPPGLDFREHIRASIEDSDVLMVVVGPRWMGGSRHGHPRIHAETDYVRIEVEAALNRHIPVIPLLVGGADMPQPSQLPENIREFAYRNAVQIDSGRDFDHHMNGLIRATDKILLSTQTSAPAASAGSGTIDRSPSDSEAKPKLQPMPAGGAVQSSVFIPVVGSGGLIIGISMIAKAGWARRRRYYSVFARGLFQPSLVQRLLRPRSAAPDVGRHRPHLAAGRGGGLSAAGPLAVARGEAVISQTTCVRNVG
jgi:hypothetical protein